MALSFKNFKIRVLILVTVLTGISSTITASPVKKEDALVKAKQFFIEKSPNILRSASDFNLVYSDTVSFLNKTDNSEFVSYYVFNAGDNNGFVIIAGDDAVKPILGYSNEGSFPTKDIPENIKNWLDFYSHEIQYIVANPILSEKTSISKSEIKQRSANVFVEPLLKNIKWNQGDPYNLLCPYSTVNKKLTVTGCVATAMAQVMKFHEWPKKGTGSYTYKFLLDKDSTTLTANFGSTNYDWDKIMDNYDGSNTLFEDSAVALLMKHCGISVKMNYDVSENGGSSATLPDVGQALKTFFGYDEDIQVYRRSFYDVETWNDLLMNEIIAGRPVLYRGSSSEGGHAFVCDGFDSEGMFHFNWGWGGNSNGYFSNNILDPNYEGIGSSSGGYASGQFAIMGIKKPDGINDNNFQIKLFGKSLATSKSSITNINTENFNVISGFINYGLNTFNGFIAVGLFKNGKLQNLLDTIQLKDLKSNYGVSSYSFKNLSLKSLSSGTYNIFLVHQPSNKSTWDIIGSSSVISNYLEVTISGNSATIMAPVSKSDLKLLSSIKPVGNIYKGKTGRFDIPVKNEGKEFYSYLSLFIYSKTNPSVNQYLKNGLAVLRNGESGTIQVSGTINLEPGTYYAYALYDSTNNFLENSFKKIEQSSFPITQFEINSEPTTPVLTLGKVISFENGNTVSKGQAISLNVNILNTGGYFDNNICAFIFPLTGGSSQGSLTKKTIYLDNGETGSYKLTGSFNIDPGAYKIGLYYYLSGWKKFPNSEFSTITINLNEVISSIDKTNSNGPKITFSIINDQITILSDQQIIKAEIFDLNGHLLNTYLNSETLPAGQLKKGVYLIKAFTENGIFNLKFIKK